MHYYYTDRGVRGPVSEDVLLRMASSGALPESTKVRVGDAKEWHPLLSVIRAIGSRNNKLEDLEATEIQNAQVGWPAWWHWLLGVAVVVCSFSFHISFLGLFFAVMLGVAVITALRLWLRRL